MKDLIPSVATSPGTETTVIDTGLRKFLPVDQGQDRWSPWVYCISRNSSDPPPIVEGDGLDIGGEELDLDPFGMDPDEQRARQWSYSSATLTLHTPGFSTATATKDTFEIHLKTRRSRKLEAINDAIGQLGIYWPRPVVDETVVTAENTWRYTLTEDWAKIRSVEIEVREDFATTGYPFQSADRYDWSVYREVSSSGVETWYLQFKDPPPAGKTLRIRGDAFYSALSADTDVLPLSGNWEGVAIPWIRDWAIYRLKEEILEGAPNFEVEKALSVVQSRLMKAKQAVLEMAPSLENGRVIIPGFGTAQHAYGHGDSSYLGALRIDHA
jgi:hypothetical protein